MKTSKLQKLAWAFFALTLTATSVFSQGRNNGNRNLQNQNVLCLEQISDLSEQQKSQIAAMEKSHQESMAEFRVNRRSTSNSIEKTKIREEMLKSVETHQNSVKNLLTENQQKEYDLLHTRGNNFQNTNRGNQPKNGYKQSRNVAGKNQGNQAGNKKGKNKQGCKGNKSGKQNRNQKGNDSSNS